MSGDHNQYQKPDGKCRRCGEVNPAEIHTCTPKQAYPENFIDALRYHTAINEQPEQEPVAWYYAGSRVEPESVALDCDLGDAQKANCTPLYTAPPQREWQGLTDEELTPIYAEYKSPRNIYLAIESALRSKNTCG